MRGDRYGGFTLLEMIIAVIVIAILATLAMPLYNAQRLKGNRSEGYATLAEIMQAQERYALENGTYTLDLGSLGYNNPQATPHGFYTIRAGRCGSVALTRCVRLLATARGGQVRDGNGNRGNLSLSSRGRRRGW